MNIRYILLGLLMGNLTSGYPLTVGQFVKLGSKEVLRHWRLDLPNNWTISDLAVLIEQLTGTNVCATHLLFFIQQNNVISYPAFTSTLADLHNPVEIGFINRGHTLVPSYVDAVLKTYYQQTTPATTATTSAAATAAK